MSISALPDGTATSASPNPIAADLLFGSPDAVAVIGSPDAVAVRGFADGFRLTGAGKADGFRPTGAAKASGTSAPDVYPGELLHNVPPRDPNAPAEVLTIDDQNDHVKLIVVDNHSTAVPRG